MDDEVDPFLYLTKTSIDWSGFLSQSADLFLFLTLTVSHHVPLIGIKRWIFSIDHEFKHHRGKSLFSQTISASETSTPQKLSPVFSHFLIHELVRNNVCDIWQEVEGKKTETKKSTFAVRFGGKNKTKVEFVINGGFVYL